MIMLKRILFLLPCLALAACGRPDFVTIRNADGSLAGFIQRSMIVSALRSRANDGTLTAQFQLMPLDSNGQYHYFFVYDKIENIEAQLR
jgi:hypothetical protein